jgi:hypothetical protein
MPNKILKWKLINYVYFFVRNRRDWDKILFEKIYTMYVHYLEYIELFWKNIYRIYIIYTIYYNSVPSDLHKKYK